MRNPNVPESLDGWCIEHRMFRFDRLCYDATPEGRTHVVESEAIALFNELHNDADTDCGLTQLIGHKGDLMLTYYARSFDTLAVMQSRFDKIGLRAFLEPLGSYVSQVELGLYGDTGKIHGNLRERGLKPHSEEWNTAFDQLLTDVAREPRNAARLAAKIPARRYQCFYPMNKKRDGEDNWYTLPFEDRARLMLDHGKIGRSWHGLVTQVISGSIGFDDWEWGVDLYADEPTTFKRLVYEMRFDEASSRYGEFGAFWIGMQFSVEQLPVFLEGRSSPALITATADQFALP